MKEYLVKDPETGRYWNTCDKNEWHIVCEIPGGATFATGKDQFDLVFRKNNYYWSVENGCDPYWMNTTVTIDNINRHSGIELAWVRQEVFTDESEIVNEEMKSLNSKKHSHYFKDVSNLLELDVYRVLKLFDVTDPCIQHAVKKLLCAGGRGVKDVDKDVHEAIDSLLRYEEMRKEDEADS